MLELLINHYFTNGPYCNITRKVPKSGPNRVFLTHFGEIDKTVLCAAELRNGLSDYVEITEKAGGNKSEIRKALEQLYLSEAKKCDIPMSEAQILRALDTDIELNAQGLACWYESRGGHN